MRRIPLNEQKKIASILSKVDEAIENTEKLIQKYENVKIGLMQDLLTKGIDENGNIRSEETHQFKDSPLGRIPMEWEIKNLNDITHLVRSGVTPRGGSEVYGNDGVVFLRSQNIYPNKFKLDDVAYISISINNRMLGSELSKFDVLLNITGASIGRSTFVPEIFPKANVNQHVCLIRIKEPSLYKSYFISSFLNSFMGQNQIIQYNSGGNREGLNYKQIREFVFPWFSNNIEFQNFYKILSKIDKKINIELENFNKLNNQKQGLMQDLLSGKVRVND
ncbi:restriction endonuclease subunit S [Empedobacter falsenii]